MLGELSELRRERTLPLFLEAHLMTGGARFSHEMTTPDIEILDGLQETGQR